MAESFFVAWNAVIPFLIYLGLGWLARRRGLVDKNFLNQLTRVIFAVFFPLMTFQNTCSADPGNVPSWKLLAFVGLGILALEGVLLAVIPRIVKEDPRRGAIIQAMYRSNFVLFGLPLTTTLYGTEKTAVASMLVVVVLTIYNVTSVLILELFRERREKISPAQLMGQLVRNPMLQGCAVGMAFFVLGWKLPAYLAKPVKALAELTTLLAMFALGGTLEFRALRKNGRYILSVLGGKLVVIPLILVAVGYALGLRGVELFLVVAVFGTPVASGSYPMALSMDSDGELAGQLVFTSTVLAAFTLFGWIFTLDLLGLLR